MESSQHGPAVRVVTRTRAALGSRIGGWTDEDVDIYTALIGGLCDRQWANDPGGARYVRLSDRAVDMYADALDLPEESP